MKSYISKLTKLSLLLMLVIGITSTTVEAQKFGHLNSGELLNSMPSVKQAQSKLDVFKKQLESKVQDKITRIQGKYADATQRQERGELSPAQAQTIQQELATEEQDLQKMQQTAQMDLVKKEEELLKPIQDEVNTAIENVSRENGFTYIFDLNSGALLYWGGGTDVTSLVKGKLGI